MKQKCPHCGKTGKRDCPALKTVICSRCCAIKRISEINCSPECESNTFGMATVEKFREIDNNLFDDVLGPYCSKYNIVTASEIDNLRRESVDETDFSNKAYLHFQMRMFPEKQYMLENFKEVSQLPVEICKQAKNEILSNLDMKTCIAVYDMGNNRKKILKIISSLPDFSENPDVAKPGEQYFDWLRLGKSKAIENDMPEAFRHDDDSEQIGILGNIILKGNSLLLETRSEQKFEFAKQMAEEYFGNMIKLEKEAVQDLAKELEKEDRDFDYADNDSDNEEIPPEIYQEVMHKLMDEHYHKFIDESIPRLDGHTPREAAKMPVLRPKLLDLMKEHIRNNESLARAKDKEPYDLSWMLNELGLDELK